MRRRESVCVCLCVCVLHTLDMQVNVGITKVASHKHGVCVCAQSALTVRKGTQKAIAQINENKWYGMVKKKHTQYGSPPTTIVKRMKNRFFPLSIYDKNIKWALKGRRTTKKCPWNEGFKYWKYSHGMRIG